MRTRGPGLLMDMDRLLVFLLVERGFSSRTIKKLMDRNHKTVGRWADLEFIPNNGLPHGLIEIVREAADQIRAGGNYNKVYARLVSSAQKYRKEDGELYADPEKVRLACERMYAKGVVGLWNARSNGGAEILVYNKKIPGRAEQYMNRFFLLPKDTIPESLKKSPNAQKPFMAVAYDPENYRAYFCDEEGKHTPSLAFRAVKEDRRTALLALSSGQVYDFCLDFFRRHNYNTRENLAVQVDIEDLDKRRKRSFRNNSPPSYQPSHAYMLHWVESMRMVRA